MALKTFCYTVIYKSRYTDNMRALLKRPVGSVSNKFCYTVISIYIYIYTDILKICAHCSGDILVLCGAFN